MTPTPAQPRTPDRDSPEWKAIHSDLSAGVQYTDMSIAPALLADTIYNAVRAAVAEPCGKAEPFTHICDVPEFDPAEHKCPACPDATLRTLSRELCEAHTQRNARHPVHYQCQCDECVSFRSAADALRAHLAAALKTPNPGAAE